MKKGKLIALDLGTSAVKACIFQLDTGIEMLGHCTVEISLHVPHVGYAEHDPEEAWESLCRAIRILLEKCGIEKEEIELVSVCSQAQCVVMTDRNGKAVAPIYNSQDARATDSFKRYFSHGIQVSELNLLKVIRCYLASGFMPGSSKDPVYKYKWAEDHLPEVYEKTDKWLDFKDYMICRLTGEFATTKDNAHAYCVYNSRENKGNWSKPIAKIFQIDMKKLPKVVESTDIVGVVTEQAAEQTGLAVGTPVIGGVIDTTGVQYGSGAVDVGETMIYWGTSGWVGTVIDSMKIDVFTKMGALITAEENKYDYYANLDSAGISYQWLLKHIVRDDGILGVESDKDDNEIYERLNAVLQEVPAGADGLLFAPWITGCRAPMEASDIGGMLVNIKNSMDKKYLVKAVVEGICYHYRLLMEAGARKVGYKKSIRFVGGGANSDQISQILADITGCVVEVPDHPQHAGAVGAAIVGFYKMNPTAGSLAEMAHRQKATKSFSPDPDRKQMYDRYYAVYKQLYRQNKKLLPALTRISEGG